jgi:hypothetical protein
MSIASDLNRATSRSRRIAKEQGHKMSPFLIDKGPNYIYSAMCLRKDCDQTIGITSLLSAEGDALRLLCSSDDE